VHLDDAKRASVENNSYTAVDTTELEEEIKVCSHFLFLSNHLSLLAALVHSDLHYLPKNLIDCAMLLILAARED
jgi:hypothetical protein